MEMALPAAGVAQPEHQILGTIPRFAREQTFGISVTASLNL